MPSIKDLAKKIDVEVMLNTPMYEWRNRLSSECQVYVFDENYVAKRFDEVCYKFCNKEEAKEILVDNLYAILRYEYFTEPSEDTDRKIQEIVSNFTMNLKTTLKKVTFDYGQDNKVELLPDGCIAFNNGVYDFRNNRWLFKYNIYDMKNVYNRIYMYDPKYLIFWYLRIDFEPLDIVLYDLDVDDLLDVLKDLTKEQRNYCFELVYNMSHDQDNKFSKSKFEHICQIIGYVLLQSFNESFVFFIGSGGNGKNSLFDGCFSSHLSPMPAAKSLDSIEDDAFITGILHNKSHNFFFESNPKTYTRTEMLKQLTGSQYQSINIKGVHQFSSIINCKHLWSANAQDDVKFGDTTDGFRRRIDMIELYYHWDSKKYFMKLGDYYDTTFSNDLREIKNDVANTILFVYLGILGMKLATKNFTKPFNFSYNDWNISYSDVDIDLKTKLEQIRPEDLAAFARKSKSGYEDIKHALYSKDKKLLQDSTEMHAFGYRDFDDMLKLLEDEEQSLPFFLENDFYISIRTLQLLLRDLTKPTAFTQAVKKIYNITNTMPLYGNKPYVLASFRHNHLKILK